MLHFKARLFGAEQERDDIDVFMRAGADRALGRRVFLRRIVEQAKDGIAHLDAVFEPHLIELQMEGDGAQQVAAHLVECVEEGAGGAVEIGDLADAGRVGHGFAIG